MSNDPFRRPDFSGVVSEWQAFLRQRGLPAELIWVFSDNLCFEADGEGRPRPLPAFQVQFTPPPPNAAECAYEYFAEQDCPLVFYRLGSHAGKSVCLILCDEWFRGRTGDEGFVPKEGWNISMRAGDGVELEEITDFQRWRQRLMKSRPLHDLDFCMDLKGVHEILAHGRVLTAYEHYALRFLHAWGRLLPR